MFFDEYGTIIIGIIGVLALLLHSLWLQKGHGFRRVNDSDEKNKRRFRGERAIWPCLVIMLWLIALIIINCLVDTISFLFDYYVLLLICALGISLIIVGVIMTTVKWESVFKDYRKQQGRKNIVRGIVILLISIIAAIVLSFMQ